MLTVQATNRKKKFHHKTRSGCTTCRQRRVKCDETKPQCLKCQKVGQICRGYEPPKTWLFQRTSGTNTSASSSDKDIVASQHKQSLDAQSPFSNRTIKSRIRYAQPQIMKAIQMFAQDTSEERRMFWYYCHTCCHALEIEDDMDLALCANIMPQVSVSIPAIRSGLIALSAYTASLVDYDNAARHREFAEHEYFKCINFLTLPQGRIDNRNIVEILMVCMLLRCLETFRNDFKRAAIHLKAALRIIAEKSTWAPSDHLDRSVKLVMDRLNAKAMVFSKKNVDSTDGASFDSTFDIQQCLEEFSTTVSDISEHIGNTSISWSPATTLLQLDTWYHKVKSNLEDTLNWNGHKGVLYSRMQFYLCRLVVSRLNETPLTKFDDDTPVFERILTMSQLFAKANSEDRLEDVPLSPKFGEIRVGFGLEHIFSIFFVAYECRDPVVRRSAIAILQQYFRREPGWDSFHAARIAEWILKQEEQALLPTVAHEIPEANRIRLSKMQFYRRYQKVGDCFLRPSWVRLLYQQAGTKKKQWLCLESAEDGNSQTLPSPPTNIGTNVSICYEILPPFMPSAAAVQTIAYQRRLSWAITEVDQISELRYS